MLVKLGCRDIITNIDRNEEFLSIADDYRSSQIKTFIDNIRLAKEQLQQNANPRMVLEALMLETPGKERGSLGNWLPTNK